MITRIQSLVILSVATRTTSTVEGSSDNGRIFLKHAYETLEVVCPDDMCRWSIPLPNKAFLKLKDKSPDELQRLALDGLKTTMISKSDGVKSVEHHMKVMRVNLTDPTQKSFAKRSPFKLGKRKGEHDPHYGPALTKRFADYEVITCHGKKPDQAGGIPRVLVTYAVHRVANEKNTPGISIKTDDYNPFHFAEFTLETYSAKYANLGEVAGKTAAGFCYILTRGILGIYEKFGILNSGQVDHILDADSFSKLDISMDAAASGPDDGLSGPSSETGSDG